MEYTNSVEKEVNRGTAAAKFMEERMAEAARVHLPDSFYFL